MRARTRAVGVAATPEPVEPVASPAAEGSRAQPLDEAVMVETPRARAAALRGAAEAAAPAGELVERPPGAAEAAAIVRAARAAVPRGAAARAATVPAAAGAPAALAGAPAAGGAGGA